MGFMDPDVLCPQKDRYTFNLSLSLIATLCLQMTNDITTIC